MQEVSVLTVINSDSEQLYKFNTKPSDVWQRLSSYMYCMLEQWAGVMKEYSRITGNHILPLLLLELFIITRLSLKLCSGTTNLTANLTKLQKKKRRRESCTWTLFSIGKYKQKPNNGFKICNGPINADKKIHMNCI